MTNKAFITAVFYVEETDSIIANVADDSHETKIATATISFDTSEHTVLQLETLDRRAVTALPFANDAVLLAAVVATLNRHTTADNEIALVPDINEPLEIRF